ncbi:MAG: hypothetical protein AAGJ11_10765 [Bacteroidota bacterium]
MRPTLRLVLLLLIGIAAPRGDAQTCTTTWQNPSGGAWTDAASWSAGVPTATSVACLTTPGTYTVTASGITAAVLRLGAASGTQTLLSSGAITLADSGAVDANGVLEWTGNYLESGVLVNRGLLRWTTNINSRGVRGGATLRNEGTLRWEDAGNVFLGGGARVENAATLTHVGTGGSLLQTSGGGAFVNAAGATAAKTGSGTWLIGTPSENRGTLSVGDQSVIRLTGASTQDGATFVAEAGGSIQLAGAVAWGGTASGAPAGQVVVSSAMTAPDAGATLDLGGTGLEWTGNYLESGVLVNRGLVRWTTNVNSRGVRGGATLRNEETLRWEDAGNVFLGGGARIENAATLQHIGTGGSLLLTSGGGTLLNEAGATVEKTGPNTWTIGTPSENRGLFDVAQGEMRFNGASRQENAAYVVDADAVLAFTASVTIAGTLTGEPDGRLYVSNATEADGTATVNLGGTGLEWTGNYLESGTLVNEGLLRWTTNVNSRGVRGGATLRNEGTLRWEDAGNVFLGGGARIENAATLVHVGTSGSLLQTSGSGTIVNEAEGTLQKTGTGTWTVGVPSENAGTLDVAEGELRLNAPNAHQDPEVAVASGATLAITNPFTLSGTMTGAPEGRLYASNAITASASAALNLGGTGLEWTGNYLESGVLVNRGLLRWTTNINSRGVRGGATLRNEGTLRWEDAGNVFLGGGARIENAATVRHMGTGGSLLQTSGGGTLVNAAGATLAKTGTGTWTVGVPSENAGLVDVDAGEVRVTNASTQTNPTFDVASGATITFASPYTLAGTASGSIAGQFVSRTDFQADGTATLNLTGTGFEWTTSYLTAGTLVNTAVVRLTGTVNGRGARNEGAVFRNEGALTWTDGGNLWAFQGGRIENAGTLAWSGTGILQVHTDAVFRNGGDFTWTDEADVRVTGGSRFENAGTFTVTGSGTLRGGNDTDVFVNEAGAEWVLTPSAPFALGTDMTSFRAVPMQVRLGGTVRLEGEIDARGSEIANSAELHVGATPGAIATVTWTGDVPLGPDADLRLDLAGAAPGTGHDQIVVLGAARPFAAGEATLDGALSVALADGYDPEAGTAFEVLRAPSFAGGFRDRTSLTVEALDLALYPSLTADAYVLTAAEGIPTLSGPLTADPDEAVNGVLAEVALTGSGFAPDVALTLECVACADPEGAGVIVGGILDLTPTAIDAVFDLLTGDVFGSYRAVVRDPRGGEAQTPFTVRDGPPVLSVAVLDGEASEEERDPGAFVVRSNRVLREPLSLPFQLGGTARLFADYVPDRLGGAVEMEAGSDSVVVSIFPLNDNETEAAESVTIQLDDSGVGVAAAASEADATLVATLFIDDGPPSDAFAVYASSPRRVGNFGPATVRFGGQGFTETTTAQVTGGDGAIDPVRTSVNEAGTVLTVQFDLTDEPVGVRDLVVSGGGESTTLQGALTIEDAVFPEVFVQVLAPVRVPRTRERRYTVLLQNRGNVSVSGYPYLAGMPLEAEWDVDGFDARMPDGSVVPWSTVARTLASDEGGQVVSLPLMTLGPNETREVHIDASIPAPQTLRLVASWIYL